MKQSTLWNDAHSASPVIREMQNKTMIFFPLSDLQKIKDDIIATTTREFHSRGCDTDFLEGKFGSIH